jgi:hypothetical protein
VTQRPSISTKRRLVVPIALAITVVGAIAAMSSSVGCGDNKPHPDAAAHDATPDTPII